MAHCYKPLLEIYDEIEELMAEEGRGSYRVEYAKDVVSQKIISSLKKIHKLRHRF